MKTRLSALAITLAALGAGCAARATPAMAQPFAAAASEIPPAIRSDPPRWTWAGPGAAGEGLMYHAGPWHCGGHVVRDLEPSPAAATQPPSHHRRDGRPPQDVFRTGIDLIEVDVVVTDGRGQPVRGLTAQDFEVLEDGAPVEIVAFREVDVPVSPPAPAPVAPILSGASLATNERELDGRVLVIVLGSFEMELYPRVTRTVLALVERLGPNDQVAMLSVGGHSGYQVEFTSDKERVVRAMKTRQPALVPDHVLLDVLRRVAVALEPVRGRRKAIALVGAGGAGLMRSADIGGDVHNLIPALQEFQAGAARANAALYAIDPRFAFALDQMVLAETPGQRANQIAAARDQDGGIQTIAGSTGGWALVRSNLFEDAVDRLYAQNSAYYLIGYRSQAPQDGKFHRITVRVTHPHMQVRARSGYVAAKPAAPDAPAPSPLDRLIGAPIPVHGLNLRVAATPVPAQSPEGSAILIVTEVNGAQLAGADGLELKAVALDASGRVRGSQQVTARLAAAPADDHRWTRVVSRLDVRPGRWRVRVAARRTDGQAEGSVFVEVDVPDFTRDLVLGGLVLGTPGRSGVCGADALPDGFPIVPVATGALPSGMTLHAAVPVRVGSRHQSGTVRLTASLVGPDGTTRDLHRSERPAAEVSERGVLSVALPSTLDPGEYRLDITARVNRASASRAVTFRIE
jgi:VWFA-related protein